MVSKVATRYQLQEDAHSEGCQVVWASCRRSRYYTIGRSDSWEQRTMTNMLPGMLLCRGRGGGGYRQAMIRENMIILHYGGREHEIRVWPF